MSHYIIIRENKESALTYLAVCKCGWANEAKYPAEIAAASKSHLDKNKSDVYAYDWRSE